MAATMMQNGVKNKTAGCCEHEGEVVMQECCP
jgi:hypothetical protein